MIKILMTVSQSEMFQEIVLGDTHRQSLTDAMLLARCGIEVFESTKPAHGTQLNDNQVCLVALLAKRIDWGDGIQIGEELFDLNRDFLIHSSGRVYNDKNASYNTQLDEEFRKEVTELCRLGIMEYQPRSGLVELTNYKEDAHTYEVSKADAKQGDGVQLNENKSSLSGKMNQHTLFSDGPAESESKKMPKSQGRLKR